ncbi:MAG: hypothetical protein JXA95_03950 [Spirochaetales bacterium]|nr:hypothetical protein [Spirochaetales bacterium]
MTGKIIKYVLLGLLVLVLASVVYAFALANGKVPIPKAAALKIAEKANMSETEREQVKKALEVYNILQKSEISGDVVTLRKMAMKGADEKEVAAQLQKSYASLSEDTLEEIRAALEITPDDFDQGRTILDKAMASYGSTGKFSLEPEEEQFLKDLAVKYGVPEEAFDEQAEGQF